ncbi:MAG TPA: aspartyl protease family protein [Steroidobacteraceae bacterium]|nr:aspartyl protease family protein [Steroidobacteraceae bacterium]
MKSRTGKFRATVKILVILAPAPWTGMAIGGGCKIAKIAELPVTMIDMHPMVTAQINGVDAMFIADSGAFYSMLSPASTAEFKLSTFPAPFGLFVRGVGGAASVSVARVKVFTLAGVPIHNVDFLVGGGDAGGGGVGLLGQNVFSIGDVEYDLAKGAIRLIHEEGCKKVNLAYWVTGTSQPYSMMDIEWTTPRSPHTTGTATINGVSIRVMFDTGAYTSVLSERAAERAGVRVDSPGVTDAGYSRGIGQHPVKTWIAPFASFKLGDEEIRNTRLRIGEPGIDTADMLIGADFFLSHRIYVASKQHKLFFTYNGGAVFNLKPSPAPDPAQVPSSAATPAPASDAPPAESAPDEPKDAAAYSRRGTAFAARRDFQHAIADLDRACELAPDEPNYFYERGIARRDSGQPIPALADFDQAIKIKFDHVPALAARAELRLQNGDAVAAVEDLEAADNAAAKEADVRFRLGLDYQHADLMPQSVAQLDLWIAAHGDDARLGQALGNRCWAKALLGQDLKSALKDCDSALGRIGKKNTGSAAVLLSRGVVRFRLGDYDKSIADFDAALALRPKSAWSLYGRGIAKIRRSKAVEGQADLAAAAAIWPSIADDFAKRDITP